MTAIILNISWFQPISMTKKLFWEDPYMTECTAKVTSVEGRKVKLDQTIFFAFCGGQESDKGTIGGINVLTATKLGDRENMNWKKNLTSWLAMKSMFS
jgi:alanyl-tRNA synthetase